MMLGKQRSHITDFLPASHLLNNNKSFVSIKRNCAERKQFFSICPWWRNKLCMKTETMYSLNLCLLYRRLIYSLLHGRYLGEGPCWLQWLKIYQDLKNFSFHLVDRGLDVVRWPHPNSPTSLGQNASWSTHPLPSSSHPELLLSQLSLADAWAVQLSHRPALLGQCCCYGTQWHQH